MPYFRKGARISEEMEYIEKLNILLKPKVDENSYKVIDLFAGCGGLSLGFEASGFSTIGYEMLEDACASYNKNLIGTCFNVKLDINFQYEDCDVLIGGPPCQPFSVNGKQQGLKDSRDGFPIFIQAVEQTKPKLFLFENVRGLMYRNKWYLDEVIAELEDKGYCIDIKLVNAKEYGVPQNRERIFVVGHKGWFKFPEKESICPTAGDALGELARQCSDSSKFLTPSMDAYILKYEQASSCVNPRDLYLDRPARTLTCRNLAGATGDMQRVRLPDGRRRRLTALEAARLQSFPDHFKFHGNETSVFNQIGNAVSPLLAYKMAMAVKKYLDEFEYKNKSFNKSKLRKNGASQLSLLTR